MYKQENVCMCKCMLNAMLRDEMGRNWLQFERSSRFYSDTMVQFLSLYMYIIYVRRTFFYYFCEAYKSDGIEREIVCMSSFGIKSTLTHALHR